MEAGSQLILVTGATGQQGGAVARELLRRGHRVRALTRNPESAKAQALRKLDAEIVKGDLDDQASLTNALASVWGVFAVQNTWEAGVEKEELQGKRIAAIARNQGVQHFVYSSVGSADKETGIPHFDNKWRVEESVRALQFPSHVILRPVFFMENLQSPFFKAGIDQGKLAVALQPVTKLQMIAVEDIGKYGAMAFEKDSDLNRRAIDIAGDALTMPATAEVLGKATGRTIKFEQAPIEEVRKFSEDYAIMLEWFDRVGYSVDINANTQEYGFQPLTLEAWAKQQDWS